MTVRLRTNRILDVRLRAEKRKFVWDFLNNWLSLTNWGRRVTEFTAAHSCTKRAAWATQAEKAATELNGCGMRVLAASLWSFTGLVGLISDQNETSAAPDSAKKPTVAHGQIQNEHRHGSILVCLRCCAEIKVRYKNPAPLSKDH